MMFHAATLRYATPFTLLPPRCYAIFSMPPLPARVRRYADTTLIIFATLRHADATPDFDDADDAAAAC